MFSPLRRGRAAGAVLLATATAASTLVLTAPAHAQQTSTASKPGFVTDEHPSTRRIGPVIGQPTNTSFDARQDGVVVTATPTCKSNYNRCSAQILIPAYDVDLRDVDVRSGHFIPWPAGWQPRTSATIEVYTAATDIFHNWWTTDPPALVTPTRPAAQQAITAELDSQDDEQRTAKVSGTATPGAEIKRNGAVVDTADDDGRWDATVSGLAVGPNRLTFDQFVDGNRKDSASVDVTIAEPTVPNGGVTADRGPTTELSRNEAVAVPFGTKATGSFDDAEFDVKLTAPAGTTFAPQASVPGAWSTDGQTFTDSADLALSGVQVTGDTLTATFDSSRSPGFSQQDGYRLRWSPKVVVSPGAAAGTGALGFRLQGTTSLGAATVSGNTTVTIPEETGVPAPTAAVVFDDDVTKRARVEGSAQDGAVVIVSDAAGRELGRPTVTDGKYSLEVVSPGPGKHDFSVTQQVDGVTSDAVTAEGDFGAAVSVTALPEHVTAGDVTISGTGETGRTVNVRVGSVAVPSVQVTNGSWSVTTEIKPSATAVAIEVSQVAQGSTVTTASTSTTPDGAIAARPVTIDEPSSHRYLANADTRVSGTATPYATVTFVSGQARFPTVRADKDGNWAFERRFGPTHVYSIVATQTRFDETTSSSDAFELRPTAQANRPLVVTTPKSGETHAGDTVTFEGTGTPDGRVRAVVQGRDELVFDYVKVGINGSWSATATLTAGREYTIEFRQTTPDNTFDNVRDFRLLPDQPAWQPAALTSPTNGHTYNPNADVEFTGTGVVGTTIVGVTSTGTTVTPAGGVKVRDDGTWSFSRQMGPTADYTITFTATRGSDSNQFELSDLKSPRYSRLTLTSATEDDRYTPGVPVTFRGTASPYARISAVTILGTDLLQNLPPVVADENGDWEFTRAFGPTNVYTIDLGQTDAYGVGEPDEVNDFEWRPVG